MSGTVGLLRYPWGQDMGVASLGRRTPRRLLRRGLAYRANPRDPVYMEALFTERHPRGTLVRADEHGWEREALAADTVVLLFPDAIGQGFGGLERRLARLGNPAATALNGRRREIVLDRPTRFRLRLRRLLERSLLVEAAALALLAAATPPLALWDLARGRR